MFFLQSYSISFCLGFDPSEYTVQKISEELFLRQDIEASDRIANRKEFLNVDFYLTYLYPIFFN